MRRISSTSDRSHLASMRQIKQIKAVYVNDFFY